MGTFAEVTQRGRRGSWRDRSAPPVSDWPSLRRETGAWLAKHAPHWAQHPFAQGFVLNRLRSPLLTVRALEHRAAERGWERA